MVNVGMKLLLVLLCTSYMKAQELTFYDLPHQNRVENLFDDYVKHINLSVFVIANLVNFFANETCCLISFTTRCAFGDFDLQPLELVSCDRNVIEKFPPRHELVFFINEHHVYDILSADYVMPIIFSRCGIENMFTPSTRKICEMYQLKYDSPGQCWNPPEKENDCNFYMKLMPRMETSLVYSIWSLIMGFVLVRVFFSRLALRHRRFFRKMFYA